MLLYLDTAISGPWMRGSDGRSRPDAEQPHLTRLAWVLEDDTQHAAMEARHLIYPVEDLRITDDSVKETQITYRAMLEHGRQLNSVMKEFLDALDEAASVVAFNWQHQKHVLACSLRRVKQAEPSWPDPRCAMREIVDLVKEPRDRPGQGYQWPTFNRAFTHFFGKEWRPTGNLEEDGRNRVQAIRTFYHAADLSKKPDSVKRKGKEKAERHYQ